MGVSNSKKLEHSTDVEAGTTILDVLNAYCWRRVLDYVCINDVVRSERVSRAWQQMVLEYLAGVHNYAFIGKPWKSALNLRHFIPGPNEKHRELKLKRSQSAAEFQNMINKMGPSFVSMVVVTGKKMNKIEAIAANCPNLTDLNIHVLESSAKIENFGRLTEWKQLKRVTFDVPQGGDNLLNSIVKSETLEELTIKGFSTLTGSFLTHLTTQNLKTLAFIYCESLILDNIISAAGRLTGLTRLELKMNSSKTLRSVHLLLKDLPNLEHLSLHSLDYEVQMVSEVTAAIGRLSRLKELSLWDCIIVTDEWLAAAAPGFTELRVVNVGQTRVTGRGVLALCQAQPALVDLGVAGLHISDEDLEACARCCSGLEYLEAWGCPALTPELPALLAWPRDRPLQLQVVDPLVTLLNKDKTDQAQVCYEGLTLTVVKDRSSPETTCFTFGTVQYEMRKID